MNTVSSIRWTARALVVLACLAPPALARAQDSTGADAKLDTVVREALQSGRRVRAIVRFKSDSDRHRGASIVNGRGGHVRRQHNDVGALTVDIDSSTANLLAYDAGVAGISVDADVFSDASPSRTRRAVRSSGAKKVRDTFNRRGSGIAIAVIDSGVQPHADLPASRIRKFVDFVNGRTRPYDDFGHGTHVAGIAAGSGVSSAGLEQPYVGLAPNVDIVALKVLDANGAGKTSTVLQALEWVADNHRAYNIKVVNLSLGHPIYEPASRDPLVRAAEALVRRGVVVVASTGNRGVNPTTGEVGFGGVTSPANGLGVIAVGAVDDQDTEQRSDDRITNYTSRGPSRFDFFLKPDIVASGHQIVSLSAPGSTLFEKYPALRVLGGTETVAAYMTLSGTSMAAPAVAGAAALVFETNPELSAHTVRALLEFTSQDLPGYSTLEQGAGYLNAFGAVRVAGLIRPSARLGSIWLARNRFPSPVDELAGESVAWGKQVVWGRRLLLGDSVYVKMAAWRDAVSWGRDLDSMVWGICAADGSNCGGDVVWSSDTCDPAVQNCQDGNVVWGNCSGDGCQDVVWSSDTCDPTVQNCQDGNVVWGNSCNPEVQQCDDDGNVVWGNLLWTPDGHARGYWAAKTVWGFWDDSVDWTDVNVNGNHVLWGNAYYEVYVLGQEAGSCEPGQEPPPGQQADDCGNVVWGNTLWILTGGGF